MAFIDNMDSVFDQSSDEELDFDVMFDEDDLLVDIVEGCDENGVPLTGDAFEGIHLSDDEPGDLDSTKDLDDKTTVKDIKDALTDKDNISGNKVENGSEQKICDNNKNEGSAKPSDDEDAKYQDNDFSKGTVDPEKINVAIAAQEASAYLEGAEDDVKGSDDVAGKTSDELDIEKEDDAKNRKDETSEDDGVGEFEGKSDLDPKVESASAYLESEVEIEDNPMAPDSLDDFDLPNDTDEEQVTANDIASEAAGDMPKLKLALEDDNAMAEEPKSDETQGADVSQGSEVSEASAYLESDDEGIIADNDEAEAHKEVQCDGSANCQCPACKAKRVGDPSLELKVSDLAESAGVDSDVEEIVDDELSDPDFGEDIGDDDVDPDLAYDPSDEDIINYALDDGDIDIE